MYLKWELLLQGPWGRGSVTGARVRVCVGTRPTAGRGRSWRGRDLLFIIGNARCEGFGAGITVCHQRMGGSRLGAGGSGLKKCRGEQGTWQSWERWDVLKVELAGRKDKVRKGLPYPS